MTRMRALLRLSLVMAAQPAALLLFHRLGQDHGWLTVDWANVTTWISQTPTDDAVVALIRAGAMGLLIVSSAGSIIHMSARVVEVATVVRWSSWFTLPAVRRAVDRVVVTSLVAGLNLAGAAMAAEPPPPRHPVVEMIERTDATQRTPVAAADNQPNLRPMSQQAGTHVVERGESLWSIAVEAAGDGAELGDVTELWLQILDLNGGRLTSGDPDLIYPGEVVLLP